MILILQHVMPSGLPTDSIDIAIIGSGPHALTLMTHIIQKRRERAAVRTGFGRWQRIDEWASSGAVERGATVMMMARRAYYEKLFDAEPGWLGPKYLKDFWAEKSWEVRAKHVKEARNGGSLTPAILTKLRKLKAESRVEFHENCQVRSLFWDNHEWTVQCKSGEVIQCDRIWVATGSQLNIQQHPLFAQVLEKYPIEVVQGFPVLDEQLCWKGCPLYLMGGFAGLQVGPTARNLSGARMASERITAGLLHQH